VEVINKRKRIMVQVGPGKKPDPISKKKKTKRAIGVTTQKVACLPSKCKSEFKHQYHKESTGSITHTQQQQQQNPEGSIFNDHTQQFHFSLCN
jgi:hypothetical protein